MIRALLSIFKDSPESFEGQEVGEKVIMLLRRHKLVVLLSLSGFALAGLVPIVALTVFSSYIITDRRIIDRDQHGFFNQKISELHADRIQDVTAHTKGILETVFHFGDIVVQTAGSERQFVFHKIPEPEKVKSAIMQIVAAKRSVLQ